jgi:hypothetical protein
MQKTSMVAGAAEVLLYGTVHGALGALIPLLTRSDVVRIFMIFDLLFFFLN